jgi:hypothetical protein
LHRVLAAVIRGYSETLRPAPDDKLGGGNEIRLHTLKFFLIARPRGKKRKTRAILHGNVGVPPRRPMITT